MKKAGGFRREERTPVRIKVPAFRVVPCDKKETSFGTLKTRSLTFWWNYQHRSIRGLKERTHSRPDDCSVFPFLIPFITSFEGSLIDLVETSTGPIGQAVSNPFEKHH